jgi:hypothetical protein
MKSVISVVGCFCNCRDILLADAGETILRFAVLLLFAALLAPAHPSAQAHLDAVPVVDPLELPRQPTAPADELAPAAADVDTRRRWSAPRLALGAAVAAAGVWYALAERRCRLEGALAAFGPSPSQPGTVAVGKPSHAPAALAMLQIAYGSPENPVTAWTGSGCSLDWTYTSQEFWSARVGTRTLMATYADVDPDAVRRWSTTDSLAQGDHPPASPEALTAMRGAIETEDYLPRLYPGLGIAAAGAVVALFFSRVGVPDLVAVDVAPERASLSLRLGF